MHIINFCYLKNEFKKYFIEYLLIININSSHVEKPLISRISRVILLAIGLQICQSYLSCVVRRERKIVPHNEL